jgi:hypothetical protein
MTRTNRALVGLALALCALSLVTTGCGYFRRARVAYQRPSPPPPLGTISDSLWTNMESNAEASDFIIYEHEFVYRKTRLNDAGQDHLKQLAARIQSGQDMPVMIERGRTAEREDTEYKYPVHLDPDLDNKRRGVVVRSLEALGVENAEERVVVAPALRPGQKASEAAAAYQQGISNYGGFGGGFGGFGGGFGGFGGFGGGFGGFGAGGFF